MNQLKALKFDLRLESKDGKDVHRVFKGTSFHEDDSLAIVEVKVNAKNEAKVQVVVDRNHYEKPDGGFYNRLDIVTGKRLHIGEQVYVITKVEGEDPDAAKNTVSELDEEIAKRPDGNRIRSIQEKMRAVIKARGAETIMGLGRHFRILDDNNDRGIDEREFSKAIREYGFNINDDEVRLLMRAFDRDANGVIDYEEFLRGVRGDMNEFRKALVHKAFKKLDANKNGVIQLDDIKLFYNAKLNPQVISGEKTEDQVLGEFLGTFDTLEKDGNVSYEEFEEYYNAISVSIDNDEYFQLMMKNVWKVE